MESHLELWGQVFVCQFILSHDVLLYVEILFPCVLVDWPPSLVCPHLVCLVFVTLIVTTSSPLACVCVQSVSSSVLCQFIFFQQRTAAPAPQLWDLVWHLCLSSQPRFLLKLFMFLTMFFFCLQWFWVWNFWWCFLLFRVILFFDLLENIFSSKKWFCLVTVFPQWSDIKITTLWIESYVQHTF